MSNSHTIVDPAVASSIQLDNRSRDLRRQRVKMLASSRRGHVGSAFSVVEIIRVLFDDILKYDPKNPSWSERDRFVLSKGHGCMALYVVLAEKGFFPESELWTFCNDGSMLGGHPDHHLPGIEASTGSLGHGLPIGVGFAISGKYEKSSHRTFVVIGDGESNEGSIWEAALCAGKHKLNNLTVIVDYNKHQSYGSTYEVQDLEPLSKKWEAFGFATIDVIGHDVDQLLSVFKKLPLEQNKPTAVICHTVKGKGVEFIEGDMEWHHKNRVTDEEVDSLLADLAELKGAR